MSKAEKIQNDYPSFTIESMQYLSSGYDSEAYIVNEDVIFKFPKHGKAAVNLYKEAHVLLEIRDRLPIKVPEVKFLGKAENEGAMAFVGYEKLTGEQMTPELIDSLSEERMDELAQEIAAFFKALHSINLKSPIDGLPLDKKAKASKEFEVIKSVAFPVVSEEIREQITMIYACILTTIYREPSCLVHNDFGASNIFFDRQTNKLCGIIDFGDIAIYDKDIDFVCLLQSQEEGFDQAFVDKILTYYGHQNRELLEKKNAFNQFYAQLENVVLGHVFEMEGLLEESLENLRLGIVGYEKHILIEKNYRYYI